MYVQVCTYIRVQMNGYISRTHLSPYKCMYVCIYVYASVGPLLFVCGSPASNGQVNKQKKIVHSAAASAQ